VPILARVKTREPSVMVSVLSVSLLAHD
jgi:hypothetical protein